MINMKIWALTYKYHRPSYKLLLQVKMNSDLESSLQLRNNAEIKGLVKEEDPMKTHLLALSANLELIMHKLNISGFEVEITNRCFSF